MRGWKEEKCIYSGGSKCVEGKKEIPGSGQKKTGSDARDHVTGVVERYCVNLRGI